MMWGQGKKAPRRSQSSRSARSTKQKVTEPWMVKLESQEFRSRARGGEWENKPAKSGGLKQVGVQECGTLAHQTGRILREEEWEPWKVYGEWVRTVLEDP